MLSTSPSNLFTMLFFFCISIIILLSTRGCIFKTQNALVMTLCHDFQSPNMGLLPWCIFRTHFLLLPCRLKPWCIFKTVNVMTLLMLFEERTYSSLQVTTLLLPFVFLCVHTEKTLKLLQSFL